MKKKITTGKILNVQDFYYKSFCLVTFSDEEGNEHEAKLFCNCLAYFGIRNPEYKEKVTITHHTSRAGNIIIDFIR